MRTRWILTLRFCCRLLTLSCAKMPVLPFALLWVVGEAYSFHFLFKAGSRCWRVLFSFLDKTFLISLRAVFLWSALLVSSSSTSSTEAFRLETIGFRLVALEVLSKSRTLSCIPEVHCSCIHPPICSINFININVKCALYLTS